MGRKRSSDEPTHKGTATSRTSYNVDDEARADAEYIRQNVREVQTVSAAVRYALHRTRVEVEKAKKGKA